MQVAQEDSLLVDHSILCHQTTKSQWLVVTMSSTLVTSQQSTAEEMISVSRWSVMRMKNDENIRYKTLETIHKLSIGILNCA